MKQTPATFPEAAEFRFELARWSIFAILILTYILVYFHRMAPGVVSEFLMADFNISGTRLGALSAIYFAIYALMQIPSGVIADTLGTRTSIIFGNLTAGLGSILFGMATGFEMACAGRFLVGLGVSVVFISIMKNNSVWFHEKVFGIMSGLTLFFGNLGAVMAAGPLAQVLTVFHWRTVFLGIGVLSLGLALAGFLLVRNKPEDMGFIPPNTHTGQFQTQNRHWLTNLKDVVMTLRVWPGFWVQLGMIGSSYAFMGLWGMPYLRDVHGLSRSFAAHHMTVQLLSFALGALFWGWISDKTGRRKPFLLWAAAAYVLSWFLLTYLSWTPGITGFILFSFMGFSASGFVITFAAAKEIVHPQLSGMGVSVVNTGCFIGTALAQPLLGYIADLTWDGTTTNGVRIYSAADYHNGFIAMILFSILALAAATRVKETYCRNTFKG
ncbi:MAG: MFS transporter [Proteobacteria bacterium]|nr:MFS transporter [Desulfobacula sp.]MBU3950818.1 MFS transporter [Pseudomonadota bacterium]MBU4132182.1 MFS transporter [Pseudomonadota bacterium]